jgi:diketogulonate reductase-like aldo/keto reductase
MQIKIANTIRYKNGLAIPRLGLGTFKLQGKLATETVLKAYELGYRLIDTATLYQNHREIGHALSTLPRNELIIASKINETDIKTNSVLQATEKILDELNIEYLDILFIHYPVIGDLNKILEQLLLLKQEKLIHSIGVSNFSVKHLNNVANYLTSIDVNQIEAHPFLFQPEIYAACQKQNIQIMAYRPFARNLVSDNSLLNEIGEQYHKTARQVVLRWLLQIGFQAIPKASSHKHLKENIDVFDFEISPENMQKIASLNNMQRTCSGSWLDL